VLLPFPAGATTFFFFRGDLKPVSSPFGKSDIPRFFIPLEPVPFFFPPPISPVFIRLVFLFFFFFGNRGFPHGSPLLAYR